MSRLPTLTLLLFLLLSLVCSASATSCHISTEWSTKVAGRSDRYVDAILPAPYCLLLSFAWLNAMSSHYALNVTDGRVT